MNEQIKLLAEQARLISVDDTTRYASDDEFEQKFAELIVKECAKVILETPVEYTEIDTMHRIRDSVKQHFGVEE